MSWEQQHPCALARKGGRRVAMQYSPLNAVPYVSRVDAGTIELIRATMSRWSRQRIGSDV